MAKEVIEVAAVFHDSVTNRRFQADHVTLTGRGDWVTLEFTAGTDDRGPVLGALFTPNAVVTRRPVAEGEAR